MRRFFLSVFLIGALAAIGAGTWGLWWVNQPVPLPSPSVDLSIEPGMLPRGVAQSVADTGATINPDLLYWWFRLSGQARQIKAGSYEMTTGITPRKLLLKLARGDEALQAVTIVEGWNFRQVRALLARDPNLKHDALGLSDDELMNALNRPGLAPEGRFFPDTYTYARGSTELALLRRALRAMDKRLDAAWAQRQPDVPVKTPQEALILASIVEKETGKAVDRPAIAGVFANRLRLGMPLQTDPTVIYGLGPSFDGNLRKKDLQADTPFNTYTRNGLPPTPIAMPGKAALLAAMHPAAGKALYFVARGDGTSQFSATLEEHNRAVNKYQRGQ
ncbi:MAG: endolytic transglycosylase MltG [Bdellovibrionales bacterium]|nr:endolytic transglycosylase MltG [Ramlibacter sp.]